MRCPGVVLCCGDRCWPPELGSTARVGRYQQTRAGSLRQWRAPPGMRLSCGMSDCVSDSKEAERGERYLVGFMVDRPDRVDIGGFFCQAPVRAALLPPVPARVGVA